MTVVLDINVVTDVFLVRHPHYAVSARIFSLIVQGTLTGVVPSHGLTTVHYLVEKQKSQADADVAVDHVLKYFDVIGLDGADFVQARNLGFADFEDSAVAITAVKAGASFIITRNTKDFNNSPVPAISPVAFLARFAPPP